MNQPAPRVGVVFLPHLPPERLRDIVVVAEDCGLDDLWLWEDCFLEGGFTSATAALAWTSSIRIGVGLLPVPLRNPALAAMEIATLSRLFPDRFIPAAGHGVLEWMEQVGARASSPMTLLREWVTATRSLLHGERVTVDGDYVRLDQVALDWPPLAAPPLLVGARGPKTLALAGECADGLVLDVPITPDGVRAAIDTAAAARAHEVVVYISFPASVTESALAETIREYGDAGATAVVLQPTVDDPDPAATIRTVAAARQLLHEQNGNRP
ncbi:LLM class flavin-dependent oxidoreductase [Jatrophihabitans sp. DSM 45814]